jgi:hypothetical protein
MKRASRNFTDTLSGGRIRDLRRSPYRVVTGSLERILLTLDL